jgi:hypothetical protein
MHISSCRCRPARLGSPWTRSWTRRTSARPRRRRRGLRRRGRSGAFSAPTRVCNTARSRADAEWARDAHRGPGAQAGYDGAPSREILRLVGTVVLGEIKEPCDPYAVPLPARRVLMPTLPTESRIRSRSSARAFTCASASLARACRAGSRDALATVRDIVRCWLGRPPRHSRGGRRCQVRACVRCTVSLCTSAVEDAEEPARVGEVAATRSARTPGAASQSSLVGS